MPGLRKEIRLQAAFGEYALLEVIGEGGAGRVYGGVDDSGRAVAVKVLSQPGADKRKRFKNETSFLLRHRHPNVVELIDHGFAQHEQLVGPFYVMPRLDGSLRDLMKAGLPPGDALRLFFQIMDGVECAHLHGAIHRDLKPENILYSQAARSLVVADFGVASFVEDELLTLVETGPQQRLANFLYAAPEQRSAGNETSAATDIFALGLMLNEMITGTVPHGAGHALIGGTHEPFGYLDRVVDQMIRQRPGERPATIAYVKALIEKYGDEQVSRQKISKIDQTVVAAGQIDDPLALNPPTVTGGSWRNGTLTLNLDREITRNWIEALHNMGSYSSVQGAPPQHFVFQGNVARIACPEHSAQHVIDHFKNWLPQATSVLRYRLEQETQALEARQRAELAAQRAAEERELRVNNSLRF